MTDRQDLSVYTLPADQPFAATLAQYLLKKTVHDPALLGRTVLLLPTRRAIRTMRAAFFKAAEGRSLLLPRMAAFGDVEELIPPGEDTLFHDLRHQVPEAVPALTRQSLLASMILAKPDDYGIEKPTPDQALRLADALGSLLDSVHMEGLSFDGLERCAPMEEGLQAHWQQTLTFLRILTEHWPQILKERGGLIDAAERQVQLLSLRAKTWTENPPDYPVIAAGSTGSLPATAALLKCVAGLPEGMVVLPGLDKDLSDKSWETLSETHPQFGFKKLLSFFGVERVTVQDFQSEAIETSRLALSRALFLPPEETDRWRGMENLPDTAVDGIVPVSCGSPRQEALTIALCLREALETEGKTAALVTPDRDLARRVACEMARWGIALDDSAGQPLSRTVAGSFLRLLAEAAVQNVAPVALLSLLKHPLCCAGAARKAHLDKVRLLEKRLLRGRRPGAGFAGLKRMAGSKAEDLLPFLVRLEEILAPLCGLMRSTDSSVFHDMTRAILDAAEALAMTDTETGADRLWRGEDGEALASLMQDLLEADPCLSFAPYYWAGIQEILLQTRPVHKPHAGHPRLSVLGPLEARLLRPDLLILGGLNEGSWPRQAAADPWMSRPMQTAFGLPVPERRIGLSAHDFAQAFGCKELILTRAAKVGGAPTVPSRFMLRLEAVTEASGLASAWAACKEKGRKYADLAQTLDMPDHVAPLDPPEPRPPVAARPRELSVTRIEDLMRDPYKIYADKILRVKKLDPIGADPDARDYGTIVHELLEEFIETYPDNMPADAAEELKEKGRVRFASADLSPSLTAFWLPRFERVVDWFLAQEKTRRMEVDASFCEKKGSFTFQRMPGGPFTVSGTADRIDLMKDGTAQILDYKTGALPKPKELLAGYAPQLPVEAFILQQNGFKEVQNASVSELIYWRINGDARTGGGKEAKVPDMPDIITRAQENLAEMIHAFDSPETPYYARPQPDFLPHYSDYKHLERITEWSEEEDKDEF